MRKALVALALTCQLFVQKAQADTDPFIAVQKELPCEFESHADISYELRGRTIRDRWTQAGGFVIIAGEYIITNHHVANITPFTIKAEQSSRLRTMISNVKILREQQRTLHFCSGKRLNITKARKIAANADIDYIVYRYSNKDLEQHSLLVPIFDETDTPLELRVAGNPGGLDVRNAFRSGYADPHSNQAPIRIDTSLVFDLGDSGQPVFTLYNNKLYIFGVGVQYKPSTAQGIIIAFSAVSEDVLNKSGIDLVSLHNAFLARKKPLVPPAP